MERRRNDTRLGVPMWTYAPGYTSPPSPDSLQLSWPEGRDDDFQRHMDENGVICAGDNLEEEEIDDVATEGDEELLSDVGTPEPEEGPPPALEDLSFHLSELLDSERLSQPTGDDCLSPSQNDGEHSLSLEDWSDDEDGWKPDQDGQENLKNLRVQSTEEKHNQLFPLTGQKNPEYTWLESHNITRRERIDHESERTSETNSQNGSHDRSLIFSSPSSRSTPLPQVLPYLPQLTLHEQPMSSKAETSSKSDPVQLGHPSTAHPPDQFQEQEPGSEITPQHTHPAPPVPSPRKIHAAPQEGPRSSSTASSKAQSSPSSALQSRSQHRPSKTSHTDLNDVRKGQLNHTLPDFSKVEPRVRFPKSKYKPPQSRLPHYGRVSKPEAPVVFKSPADIVKEVLLSSTDGPLDTAISADTHNPLNGTVPEEFRCPLQASTLVQQLQEDYNKLLTKYAEAENTIDRLRLEAKVRMYSDLTKPSQPILSGVLKEGSKVMTLTFPQAQKAELGTNTAQPTQQRLSSGNRGTPTRPPSVDSSRWSECLSAAQLTEALSNQARRFQLQVNDFEKLLKSGKLKPYDQTRGLSELSEGQESVERAYLSAREQHRQLLKQTGAKCVPFDSDRELEGLIFQSGIRLEELREWVEQSVPTQATLEPTLIQPPPALQPCVSPRAAESQPESPRSALHPEVTAGLEVSSVSETSDKDREQETLASAFHPLRHKSQRVQRDFSDLLDRDLTEEDHSFRDSLPHPTLNERIKDQQLWRSKGKQDSINPVHLLPLADSFSGPTRSSPVCESMETFPEAPLPASGLPGRQDSGRRPAGSRKSHGNLGGNAAPKDNTKILRASSQDGVMSPETDSGFVGSESSRLTPGAHSPVQQSAAARPARLPLQRVTRPSVTREKCRINPQPFSVDGPGNNGSPSHPQASSAQSRDCVGANGGTPESTGRRGEAGRRHPPSPLASSSPQRWRSSALQPWPSGIVSEGECARSLSGDEVQERKQHTQPSLTVPYHHGGQLRARSLVQLTDRHEAFQSLHAEVETLRQNLERSLRTASSPSRVKTPSSDTGNRTTPHTSICQHSHFRSLDRGAARKGSQASGRTVNEERERRSSSTPRRRSASVPRLKPELETTDSEPIIHIPAHSTVANTRRVRAETGTGRKPSASNHRRSASSDRSDQRSSEAGVQLCPDCLAHGIKTPGRSDRNAASLGHTRLFSNRCPLCGASGPVREAAPPPAQNGFGSTQNSSEKERQPVRSPHKQRGGVYMAVAPPPVISRVPVLQYVPVCSSVLCYSSPAPSSSCPLYFSLNEQTGHRSSMTGHRRRSHSVDVQHSLNKSLDRAFAAASRMQEVSRRMTRSLASGLQHTSPLAQSCIH